MHVRDFEVQSKSELAAMAGELVFPIASYERRTDGYSYLRKIFYACRSDA